MRIEVGRAKTHRKRTFNLGAQFDFDLLRFDVLVMFPVPEQTKAALHRNKTSTLQPMKEAKDDNELLIGLYSIRDFGNLDMLRDHRLNP